MYASMAGAALVIELIFKAVGLVPGERHAKIVETAIHWNYTTILNIIFLALAVGLVIRFLRTGGPEMLKDDGQADESTPDVAWVNQSKSLLQESMLRNRRPSSAFNGSQ